jgi:hypothetical protein
LEEDFPPYHRGSDRSASEVVSGAIEVSSRTEYHAVYLACCINVSLWLSFAAYEGN